MTAVQVTFDCEFRTPWRGSGRVGLFEDQLEDQSYFLSYNPPIRADTDRHESRTTHYVTDVAYLVGRVDKNYTIFEGTSEIQRLVIARAISGVHIQ